MPRRARAEQAPRALAGLSPPRRKSSSGHPRLGGAPQSPRGEPCLARPPEQGEQRHWARARFTGSAAATAAPANPELRVGREERGDGF